MHRQPILNSLIQYRPLISDQGERETLEKIITFIQTTPACFERDHPSGHVTGSAMVVSYRCDAVLLTHHKKLGRWLQLGGHSDGHPLTWEVALREAYEESGLGFLKLYGSPQSTVYLPFDVDAHLIPARGAEAAHIHYDLRYVVFGDSSAPFTITSESNDLRWVPLDEVAMLSDEPSLLRMVAKVRGLFTPHPSLTNPAAQREVSLAN